MNAVIILEIFAIEKRNKKDNFVTENDNDANKNNNLINHAQQSKIILLLIK